MDVILEHPANAGVVRSLCRKKGGAVSVFGPDAGRDPYLGCGSHPEVVERVWDQLGRGFPQASRRILCGTPVLVHPETGVVLAVCYGTSYCLRLPDGALPAALQAGCETSHRWGDGKVTDLSAEFGASWVFGCWAADEEQWCKAVAAESEKTAQPVAAADLARRGASSSLGGGVAMPEGTTIYDLHSRLLRDTFVHGLSDSDAFLIFVLFHYYQIELGGSVLTDRANLQAGDRVHADAQRGCSEALASLWAGRDDERASYTHWYHRWNGEWGSYGRAEGLSAEEKSRLRALMVALQCHPFVGRFVPEDHDLLAADA